MNISVVGAYQTKFGELWDKSLEDLITDAIKGCLKDGSVAVKDIQAVYVGNMLSGLSSSQQHLGALVSQTINTPIPVIRVEAACASGGVAIHTAIQAIQSDSVDTALVLGVEKMTDLDSQQIVAALMAASSRGESSAGLSFPGLYAILAQAYCQQFKATEADLANVSVKNHHHAQFNTKAHLQFPVSIKQVLESPKVSDPLKMLDCSPISDGAAAVFIANPKWVARNRSHNGVVISGSGLASDSLSLTQRSTLTELKATKIASQKAYAQAGVGPDDIDCVEVHDCFSIAEILALEDLGFYQKGEGYHYLTKEETWLGGRRPVNTSGGLKACGHPVGATGLKQVVEVTEQLRGSAGRRQVDNAKVGIAHNVGGTGGTAVVHVLKN